MVRFLSLEACLDDIAIIKDLSDFLISLALIDENTPEVGKE